MNVAVAASSWGLTTGAAALGARGRPPCSSPDASTAATSSPTTARVDPARGADAWRRTLRGNVLTRTGPVPDVVVHPLPSLGARPPYDFWPLGHLPCFGQRALYRPNITRRGNERFSTSASWCGRRTSWGARGARSGVQFRATRPVWRLRGFDHRDALVVVVHTGQEVVR